MSFRRTYRDFTITDFIADRFVGNIVSDVRIRDLDAFYRINFTYNYAIFDFCARFRILFNKINCGFTRRFYRFDDVFDFFRDDFFPMRTSFQVTFTRDCTTRYRMRAGFKTFTIRIDTRIDFSVFEGIKDSTCGILDDPARFDDRFLRFKDKDTTLQTFYQDDFTFVCVAACLACGFFRVDSLRIFVLRYLVLFLAYATYIPLALVWWRELARLSVVVVH